MSEQKKDSTTVPAKYDALKARGFHTTADVMAGINAIILDLLEGRMDTKTANRENRMLSKMATEMEQKLKGTHDHSRRKKK